MITDFYVRLRSRPIIEYCSDVRFAPHALKYVQIEEDDKPFRTFQKFRKRTIVTDLESSNIFYLVLAYFTSKIPYFDVA
jgi:hypothetical protein